MRTGSGAVRKGQHGPFDTLVPVWQHGNTMSKTPNQFCLTHAASTTGGATKTQFPIGSNMNVKFGRYLLGVLLCCFNVSAANVDVLNPAQKGTGFFRVAKIDGRWWFLEDWLFWAF